MNCYLTFYFAECLNTKNHMGHRDRMVVEFITTYAISAYYHLHSEFESC